MKKNLAFAVALLLSLCMFTFSSCDDDDEKDGTGKPVINLSEVGEKNSQTGVVGNDLHLEGEITAENLVKRIDIEIHQEDGGDFKIEKSFTEGKYIGVKNVLFHEHIDIPSDAPAGNYHLHFTVTDGLGQSTTVQSELTLTTNSQTKGSVNVEQLKLGELDNPGSGIAYAYGHLTIQAKITTKQGNIQTIKINAHQESGEGKIEETDLTTAYNKGTGLLKAVFPAGGEATIPIDQPTGEYHLNLIVTLDNGESQTFSKHVEISDKPFIENFEVGSGHEEGELNNHTGSISTGNLHIAGTLYCAMNRLKKITMTITSKTDGKQLMTQTWDDTNYSGAKQGARNDHFHEHPVFPKGTQPGDYTFRFTVEDREAETCVREYNLKLIK